MQGSAGRGRVRVAAAVAGLALAGGAAALFQLTPPAHASTHAFAAPDAAVAREAFARAYTVFMHARCMNCHPAGDVPLQGEDSHPHAQNVKRGTDGKGRYAMKCSACHQDTNLPGANMPPGVATWHLPPESMRMPFEGLTPAQLCEQLKDPKRNGGKTIEALLEHVAHDPLVLWGWEPGDGRSKPPLTHAEFVRQMRLWAENGAVCPE